MNFSFANDYKYCTVRIEIIDNQVNLLGSGTGFYFDITNGDNTKSFVITNKHVVKGANRGRFQIHRANEDGSINPSNTAGLYLENFESHWIMHPDKHVDLAAYPLPDYVRQAKGSQINPFIRTFSSEMIPSEYELQELNSIENIFMVGYPNSLWDEHHKLPIIRHGITATDPKIKFNWKNEFVIDCACFPGSSGSPVIIYKQEINKYDSPVKIFLAGILYAGPMRTSTGEISIKEIPARQELQAEFRMPINLGYVISSKELLAFI